MPKPKQSLTHAKFNPVEHMYPLKGTTPSKNFHQIRLANETNTRIIVIIVACGQFTLRTMSLRSCACGVCGSNALEILEQQQQQYPAYACARSDSSNCGASEHPSWSRNVSQLFSYIRYGVGDGSFYSLILRVSQCIPHI